MKGQERRGLRETATFKKRKPPSVGEGSPTEEVGGLEFTHSKDLSSKERAFVI